MIRRSTVQRALGALWLLDGLLQLKPGMFTAAFPAQVILPAAQDQPGWIAALVTWGVHLVSPHIGVFNAGFALVQASLGALLISDVASRWTLAASVLWALTVWAFGEGFGRLLAGQQLLAAGAPGPGVLYGLVSVAVWPAAGDRHAWSPWAVRFGQVAAGAVWLSGFVLLLLARPGALAESLAFPWAVRALASVRGGAIVLAAIELDIGLLMIVRRAVPWAAWASIVVALLFWWVGQDFGQMLSALGTDVNSGPLLILLALCASPELLRHRLAAP